jgi:hypothetical protein
MTCYRWRNTRRNSHPTGQSNTYLIWDPFDALIGEATSFIQAQALIYQHQPTRREPSTEQHDKSDAGHQLAHRVAHRDCQSIWHR